jgi:hypothetical protein
MPTRNRIAAPLVLLRDPQQDVIGLVRILLPRPEKFLPNDPLGAGVNRLDARLPLKPLALGLVEGLTSHPGVGAALAARRYHALSLAYEPLDPPDRRDLMRPFARACVSLTLEAAAQVGESAPRVTLDADLDGSGDEIAILRLHATVSGDPTLAALLAN